MDGPRLVEMRRGLSGALKLIIRSLFHPHVDVSGYRTDAAQQRGQEQEVNRQK